jgi:chromate reductase
MDKTVKILGFAGSLRKGSYNRALLRSAGEMVPPEASLEIFDLDGFPLYNQDLEKYVPAKVTEFKAKIKAADALLIITPEYNYSMPGVLKNAIDWASRPPGDNAFQGKPTAIMSASTGMLGGARAQYHLRQSLVVLDVHPINKPEIMISFAEQKFDAAGKLTDEKAKELIKLLFKNLIDWSRKLQSGTVTK